MLLAAAGSDVQPHLDAALARSDAANARRNASQIARLVLQDQDLVLRDLGRIDGDMERLDEQVAELETRVQAIAETDVLAAQLSGEAPDMTPLSANIDRVQGEADRLLAQLGDREQMLGRFSSQAQGWEGPSLSLQQRADFASRLSMASSDLKPLSENMREGYRQIMERGLAVDGELTARLGRSQALKARLVALEAGMQDARATTDEALGLAARIEAGATVTPEAVPEAAAAHPVIAAVLERDQTITALRTERGQLAQQLLDTRNELNAARQEIVDVTRQREAAMAGVENARLLLNRLRENQDLLKESLHEATATTPGESMNTQDAADQMAEAALRQRFDAVLGERDSLRADQERLQKALMALTAERDSTKALLRQANARIDLLFSENQELISAASVCTLNEGGEADHLAAAGGFPLSPPDPWLTGSAVRHSEARALEDILGQSLSSLRARRGRVNLDGLRLEPRVVVAPDAAPSLILAASASTTDD
jgi:chromosome segregation ATPase